MGVIGSAPAFAPDAIVKPAIEADEPDTIPAMPMPFCSVPAVAGRAVVLVED